MSKRRMKPLVGALLLLALIVSSCIVYITIEIYSWDHYYRYVRWWIHFQDCQTFSYERWWEIYSMDYLRVDVVIRTSFYDVPCSNIYYVHADLLAESWVEFKFVDPLWTCALPPDTAVVSSGLSGFIDVTIDTDDPLSADVNFHFDGYSEDPFACEDAHGYAQLLEFDMDWESTDSVYFDLWAGEFYFKGTKTLTAYHDPNYEVREDGGVGLTGIEYTMSGTFDYPVPTAAEMASFEARNLGDRVEVAWSTTSEIDNAGFHVLRGTSGKGPFEKVTDQLIPSRGTELSGADYTFVDRDIAMGTECFYRLEVIDVEGKVGFTEPVKADTGTPVAFALAQNYPNPFNPVTAIMYNLPTACHVRLDIYNVLGQLVATLVDEHQAAGSKVVGWNGKNSTGIDVTSGVYFYKIHAGEFVEMKKMILLR